MRGDRVHLLVQTLVQWAERDAPARHELADGPVVVLGGRDDGDTTEHPVAEVLPEPGDVVDAVEQREDQRVVTDRRADVRDRGVEDGALDREQNEVP